MAFCRSSAPTIGPDDLRGGLEDRVLAVAAASASRMARAGASRSDSGASCAMRTSTLFCLASP